MAILWQAFDLHRRQRITIGITELAKVIECEGVGIIFTGNDRIIRGSRCCVFRCFTIVIKDGRSTSCTLTCTQGCCQIKGFICFLLRVINSICLDIEPSRTLRNLDRAGHIVPVGSVETVLERCFVVITIDCCAIRQRERHRRARLHATQPDTKDDILTFVDNNVCAVNIRITGCAHEDRRLTLRLHQQMYGCRIRRPSLI